MPIFPKNRDHECHDPLLIEPRKLRGDFAKLEILKGRLAHKHPNISLGELFEMLCDLGLTTWDKNFSSTSAKASSSPAANTGCMTDPDPKATSSSTCTKQDEDEAKTAAPRSTLRKRIPRRKQTSHAQVVRDVFDRAENRCANCDSVYALEVDHVFPRTKGGASDAENLRSFADLAISDRRFRNSGRGRWMYADRFTVQCHKNSKLCLFI